MSANCEARKVGVARLRLPPHEKELLSLQCSDRIGVMLHLSQWPASLLEQLDVKDYFCFIKIYRYASHR